MIRFLSQRAALPALVAAICAASPVRSSAQLVTVDAADTASGAQASQPTVAPPTVSYDDDPQVVLPLIPDNLLAPYLPSPVDTANAGVSAAQSQNAVGVAALALGLSGLASGFATYESAPYTSQQPAVITSRPDTYTMQTGKKAAVYYVPPIEPALANAPLADAVLKFDFGTPGSPVAPGAIAVTEQTAYGKATGYGWGDASKVTSGDAGYADPTMRDYCKVAHGRAGGAIDTATPSPTPFYVDLPNGTYKITVASAPAAAGQTSRLSVWAEGGPELVLSTNKAAGVTGSFTINVKDGRLTLEFFNSLDRVETTDPNTWAVVQGVTVERVPEDPNRKPVIYVASDSTAAKYAPSVYPFTGWGDRLDRFLTDDVVVDDRAVAGASSKSFYERGWLRNIANRIKPGDYLFIMFAINDSADDLPTYPATKRKTSPASDFKAYMRQYVNVARSNGATPIFITSQTKRSYDMYGRFSNSVGGWPQAMRELGAELEVPVVDLNAKSIVYLDSIGVEASKQVYFYVEPGKYPGWPNGASDYIHLQDFGATQYARLIMQGIRELNVQPLAQYVTDGE